MSSFPFPLSSPSVFSPPPPRYLKFSPIISWIVFLWIPAAKLVLKKLARGQNKEAQGEREKVFWLNLCFCVKVDISSRPLSFGHLLKWKVYKSHFLEYTQAKPGAALKTLLWLLPNSRFPKLPSPAIAIDLKIWKALYSRGWLVCWLFGRLLLHFCALVRWLVGWSVLTDWLDLSKIRLSAPCRTFLAPCRTFSAPCRRFLAPCRTFLAPCHTFSAPCRTFLASCRTFLPVPSCFFRFLPVSLCFHQIGPLGRFGLVAAMSVGLRVCVLSPSHAILPEVPAKINPKQRNELLTIDWWLIER